jgi:glycosyltransferase involved in cell wall biosynthesis
MRILIASDLHWPTINGIATFGQNLARGLADAGHEVAVVAPSQTGKKSVEIDGNHRIFRTASVIFPFYQNLRISLSPYREMNKIVQTFEPDVIHIQTPLGIGMAAFASAKKYEIPTVATNHAMSENLIDNMKLLAPFARPIDRILRQMVGRFYLNADYITLPTKAAIDIMKPDGFPRPYAAISNGIDLSRFKPGKVNKDFYAKFSVPSGVPVVMYLGRLDAEKHVVVLLRAAHRLMNNHKFHLLIAGAGNDSDHLAEVTQDLEMGNQVTFTGRFDEADKAMLLRMGSVFAMTSPAELQSIATLEAMATGMPVVAVNAGALYELCQEGTNGYLFELDDDEAMAEALGRILADHELRERMGQESLAIATTHDLNKTIRQFEDIYRNVAGKGSEPEKVLTEAV